MLKTESVFPAFLSQTQSPLLWTHKLRIPSSSSRIDAMTYQHPSNGVHILTASLIMHSFAILYSSPEASVPNSPMFPYQDRIPLVIIVKGVKAQKLLLRFFKFLICYSFTRNIAKTVLL